MKINSLDIGHNPINTKKPNSIKMKKPQRIKLSICLFNEGTFEILIIDQETHKEIIFSGNSSLSKEDEEIAHKIAPGCVWSEYELVD